jgi:hypothetical protein
MKNVRFQLNAEQKASLFKAFKKYFAPLILLFLIAIQQGTPLKDALLVIYAGALQMAINFLSKFISEDK